MVVDLIYDFPSQTKIDATLLKKGQRTEITEPFMVYITQGKGIANQEPIKDSDLISGNHLQFSALNDVQLIIIHIATDSKVPHD